MACETCSPLYTWTPFNDGTGRCFRYSSLPSSPSQVLIELVSKNSSEYSASGSTLYSTYDTFGVSIGPTTTLNNSIWKTTTGTDGPMNRSAIWTNLVGSLSVINLPINIWMGFSVCLSGSPTSAKVYYVGIGANDAYRIVLDGDEIVNTYYGPNNGTSEPYGLWHLYPVTIGTGNHTLEIYGLNIAKDAALGCEIYDNTFSELTASTVISDLNIVYSTSGETEAKLFRDLIGNYVSSGETCPKGYYYSECDGTCKQLIVCEDLSLTPTPTSSLTPTPTPTITPTTTSRSLSRFIRSCCGDRLYRITEENGLFTIGVVISIYPEMFCYTVVPNPTINERYTDISIRLGYNLLDSCNNEKCQPCPTPTPTPSLPIPTRLPEPVQPIPGQTTNECGVLTLLDLGIICDVINPTMDNPNGGILSVYVTGGTAPYTIIWETPSGSFITGQTIYNQVGGDYIVTVYDKWRDFTATTICTLVQPVDCIFDSSVSVFNLPTPTPTITASVTPTPTTPVVTPTASSSLKGRFVIITGANNLVITYTAQTGVVMSNVPILDNPQYPAFSTCILCSSTVQIISGTYTNISYTQTVSCISCYEPTYYFYVAEIYTCNPLNCSSPGSNFGETCIVRANVPLIIGGYYVPVDTNLLGLIFRPITGSLPTPYFFDVTRYFNNCVAACNYVPLPA